MKFHPLLKPVAALVWALCLLAPDAHAWAPKRASLMTKWAALVNPQKPMPEYPRPQLVRADWQNLNGIWQYQPGAEGDVTPTGVTLSREICVPFPVESALSGVMEHHERLWYRRNFTVPAAWKGRQLMLNFGAVDYEAEVFVNGKSVGTHTGGYESFSYDISPFLEPTGPQELIVRVFDSTGRQGQPLGKQSLTPGGVVYKSTTGIWQTVWLEPIDKTSIANLHMVPDIDKGVVNFTVNASAATAKTNAIIQIRDGKNVVGRVTVKPGVETSIPIKNAKLWSPDSPFLYDVAVTLQDGKTAVDRVSSYFGMRKISLGKVGGFQRMLLNNKFIFQIGPLDQGFWPDGLYTAPTDDALKYDIQVTKELGFNMTRKHIKVEPARWYYWADKLGLMVWQDMPSTARETIDKPAFEKQMVNIIETHWNSPAIIMWVIFNEDVGRHDTAKLVDHAKVLDSSRLTNRDSGGGYNDDAHEGAIGDVDDVHAYPPPSHPAPDTIQASANGEYGGIGYLVKGHAYKGDDYPYSTYTTATTQQDLHDQYGLFSSKLKDYRDNFGLSAAVYTQITDVEEEINGLLTYDRVLKVDPAKIRLANAFNYALPTYQAVVPTSKIESQTYKYVFDPPAPGWSDKSFDDANWKSGPGGFGMIGTQNIGQAGTVWNTSDIWLRRTFTLPTLSAEQVNRLLLTDYHDEDIEVYFNGVLAYKKGGFSGDYEYTPLSDAAKAALVVGGANVMAVHCHNLEGGQYVDVGLSLKVPAASK